MLSYDPLCQHHAAFPSPTGSTRAEFEALASEFEAAERDRRGATATTRRDRVPRRNAHGAGHPYRNDARARLLMALVWLRTYPTYEVLGLLFVLHRSGKGDGSGKGVVTWGS